MSKAEDRVLNMYSEHIRRTSSFCMTNCKKKISGTQLQLTYKRKIVCFYRDEIYLPHFKRKHTMVKPVISIYTGYQDKNSEKIYTGDILSVRIDCRAINGLVYLKYVDDKLLMVLHCGTEYIAGLDFDPEDCIHIHNPQLSQPIAEMFRSTYEPCTRAIIDNRLGCRPEIGREIYHIQ